MGGWKESCGRKRKGKEEGRNNKMEREKRIIVDQCSDIDATVQKLRQELNQFKRIEIPNPNTNYNPNLTGIKSIQRKGFI